MASPGLADAPLGASDPLDRLLGPSVYAAQRSPVSRGGGPGVHDEALAAAERRLTGVEALLDAIPDRIDAALAVAAAPVSRGGAGGIESFEVGPMADAADPDAALVEALRQAQRPTRGVIDDLGASVKARLDAILAAVRHAARVETADGGRTVAITEVGWGGDTATLCAPSAPSAASARHHRTLAVTLRGRQARLRFVTVVVSGAARVAASMAGGGVSALPAIYRYVEQLLDEYDTLTAADAAHDPEASDEHRP